MDIKGQGFEASVVAAEQSDQWLIEAAHEIRLAAEARGLEVPAFAGGVATEATLETTEVKLDTAEVKEALLGQLDTAHNAHVAVVDALNTGRRKNKFEAADRETAQAEFEAWLSEDRLTYIAKQVAAGRKPHVTATPNVEVDAKTYENAARKFGEDQPYKTDFYSGVVEQCTPAELSGTDPSNGNKIHFNVFFEDFDGELYGTPAESAKALAKLQEDNPFLEAPAMLKALTHTFTLREARGGKLSGSGVADLTYDRDYTVEPKRIGARLYVPGSGVSDSGYFVVSSSSVRFDLDGRALVG